MELWWWIEVEERECVGVGVESERNGIDRGKRRRKHDSREPTAVARSTGSRRHQGTGHRGGNGQMSPLPGKWLEKNYSVGDWPSPA